MPILDKYSLKFRKHCGFGSQRSISTLIIVAVSVLLLTVSVIISLILTLLVLRIPFNGMAPSFRLISLFVAMHLKSQAMVRNLLFISEGVLSTINSLSQEVLFSGQKTAITVMTQREISK